MHSAFNAGELDRDVVCVVRWQGPQANGMPELHKLTPPLAEVAARALQQDYGLALRWSESQSCATSWPRMPRR